MGTVRATSRGLSALCPSHRALKTALGALFPGRALLKLFLGHAGAWLAPFILCFLVHLEFVIPKILNAALWKFLCG